MTSWTVMFESPILKELTGVDCSTPKCLANAFGTGRILRDLASPAYYVEFYCPDCETEMHVNSRDVDALAAELMAARPSQQASILRRWVTPRIGDVHPCRRRT
jgi:hypothetical protein